VVTGIRRQTIATLFLILVLASSRVSANFGVDRVEVNHRRATSMGKVLLTDQDLIGGNIVVEGSADDGEIQYSFDAGRTWETTSVENSRFQIEYDAGDNSRDYILLLKSKAGDQNFSVVVQVQNRAFQRLFEDWFSEIRDIYNDERLFEFLEFFEEDAYDNFTRFQERMEETFDLNGSINLHVRVATVTVEGDTALVRVDFQRSWDDSSFTRGSNDIVRFRKQDGRWRIFDIEDEALFVIGVGTFRGNVSDT